MSGINGMETAHQARKIDVKCLIAFLTASTEHMGQAFSCHAFDYVEKPPSRERIFTVLGDALAVSPETERFVELPGGRGVLIGLDELVSAESNGNYLSICLADGRTHRQRMTFTEFTRLLDGDARFLSTIRGVVLNMDYIDDLRDGCCVLMTGAVFPVKVRDGAEIEAALNRYRFERLRNRQKRGEG